MNNDNHISATSHHVLMTPPDDASLFKMTLVSLESNLMLCEKFQQQKQQQPQQQQQQQQFYQQPECLKIPQKISDMIVKRSRDRIHQPFRPVRKLPVITIFGTSQQGQKCCLHVHGCLPYFFVEVPQQWLVQQPVQQQQQQQQQTMKDALAGLGPADLNKSVKRASLASRLQTLGKALEQQYHNRVGRAAQSKQNPVAQQQQPPQPQQPQQQHQYAVVHDLVVVRGRPFYGYYTKDKLYIKIFVYDPRNVSKLAALLQSGCIMGHRFQPHEAHIPYLLQFMIDNNLYGMDFIEINRNKLLFRSPLLSQLPLQQLTQQLTQAQQSRQDQDGDTSIPLSETIERLEESGFISSQSVPASQIVPEDDTKRMSCSEVEMDVLVDSILNGTHVLRNEIGPDSKNVRLVQSLKQVWDEEKRRRRSKAPPGVKEGFSPPKQDILEPSSDASQRINMTLTELDRVMQHRLDQMVMEHETIVRQMHGRLAPDTPPRQAADAGLDESDMELLDVQDQQQQQRAEDFPAADMVPHRLTPEQAIHYSQLMGPVVLQEDQDEAAFDADAPVQEPFDEEIIEALDWMRKEQFDEEQQQHDQEEDEQQQEENAAAEAAVARGVDPNLSQRDFRDINDANESSYFEQEQQAFGPIDDFDFVQVDDADQHLFGEEDEEEQDGFTDDVREIGQLDGHFDDDIEDDDDNEYRQPVSRKPQFEDKEPIESFSDEEDDQPKQRRTIRVRIAPVPVAASIATPAAQTRRRQSEVASPIAAASAAAVLVTPSSRVRFMPRPTYESKHTPKAQPSNPATTSAKKSALKKRRTTSPIPIDWDLLSRYETFDHRPRQSLPPQPPAVVKVERGDFVYLRAPEGQQPYIGFVESIEEAASPADTILNVQWMYRSEETHVGRVEGHGVHEVFAVMGYVDKNALATVIGKCRVVLPDEFQQLGNDLQLGEPLDLFYCRCEYQPQDRLFLPLNETNQSQLFGRAIPVAFSLPIATPPLPVVASLVAQEDQQEQEEEEKSSVPSASKNDELRASVQASPRLVPQAPVVAPQPSPDLFPSPQSYSSASSGSSASSSSSGSLLAAERRHIFSPPSSGSTHASPPRRVESMPSPALSPIAQPIVNQQEDDIAMEDGGFFEGSLEFPFEEEEVAELNFPILSQVETSEQPIGSSHLKLDLEPPDLEDLVAEEESRPHFKHQVAFYGNWQDYYKDKKAVKARFGDGRSMHLRGQLPLTKLPWHTSQFKSAVGDQEGLLKKIKSASSRARTSSRKHDVAPRTQLREYRCTVEMPPVELFTAKARSSEKSTRKVITVVKTKLDSYGRMTKVQETRVVTEDAAVDEEQVQKDIPEEQAQELEVEEEEEPRPPSPKFDEPMGHLYVASLRSPSRAIGASQRLASSTQRHASPVFGSPADANNSFLQSIPIGLNIQSVMFGSSVQSPQDHLRLQGLTKQLASTPLYRAKRTALLSQITQSQRSPSRQSFRSPSRALPSQPLPPSTAGPSSPKSGSSVSSATKQASQNMTVMSIEIFVPSRAHLLPNPKFDAVRAIFYSIYETVDVKLERVTRGILLWPEDDFDEDQPDSLRRSGKPRYALNQSGILQTEFGSEYELFKGFVDLVQLTDPDILSGFEVQKSSLGFLLQRASIIFSPSDLYLDYEISRTPVLNPKRRVGGEFLENDEYGRTHQSGINIKGRIIVNLWRVMRHELRLTHYSFESVVNNILGQRFPLFSPAVLTKMWRGGQGRSLRNSRAFVLDHFSRRSMINLQLINQLDVINRTAEMAKILGIDFFSVMSRGSQYRVESMMFRLAKPRNHVLLSPSKRQVTAQRALESLPLVMEPESTLYTNPVVVLDFQSLYPSMIIAYNLCYSTCLGKIMSFRGRNAQNDTAFRTRLGVMSQYAVPSSPMVSSPQAKSAAEEDADELLGFFARYREHIFVTPNATLFVKPEIRPGVLPRMLKEMLETRVMVKQAMKQLDQDDDDFEFMYRVLNARQFGLKMVSNVTYGYSAANFSGRMPCSDLADSIVQLGRQTLERAIDLVERETIQWHGARVVYGDTDSMFVELPGYTREEAFEIGKKIAEKVTSRNPRPVKLQFEKVFHPCILVSKKRYVGYAWESAKQQEPVLDAKGLETIRRDTCPIVSKMMDRVLRILFDSKDLSLVKHYVQSMFDRIMKNQVSMQDFVFAKEVKLGTYSERYGLVPPAAIVARRAMKQDERAEPLYAERVPYVVVYGPPKSRLIDLVVDPLEILNGSTAASRASHSPTQLRRIHATYYITKQIIPALDRLLSLVGVDIASWYAQMPKTQASAQQFVDEVIGSRLHHRAVANAAVRGGKKRSRAGGARDDGKVQTSIDSFYRTKSCMVCGTGVVGATNPVSMDSRYLMLARYICFECIANLQETSTVLHQRLAQLERRAMEARTICAMCMGCRESDLVPVQNGEGGLVSLLSDQCQSVDCPVLFSRRNELELQLHNAKSLVEFLRRV